MRPCVCAVLSWIRVFSISSARAGERASQVVWRDDGAALNGTDTTVNLTNLADVTAVAPQTLGINCTKLDGLTEWRACMRVRRKNLAQLRRDLRGMLRESKRNIEELIEDNVTWVANN